MKNIIIIALVFNFNLFGQNLFEIERKLKKELVDNQIQFLKIEKLIIEANKLFFKKKFYLANIKIKNILRKLSKINGTNAKIIEMKKLNSKVYISWAEKILQDENLSFNQLKLANENLDNAAVLDSVNINKIVNLRQSIKDIIKKRTRKNDVKIKNIIDQDGVLDPQSKGIARRNYLTSIRLERGKLYLKQGNYSQAIVEFQALLAINPYHTSGLKYLEKCYRNLQAYGRSNRDLVINQIGSLAVWKWALPMNVKDRGEKNIIVRERTSREKLVSNVKIRSKLDIILPFFQVKNLAVKDVLDRLKSLSKKNDLDGEGLSFVIKNLKQKRGKVIDEEDFDEEIPIENSYIKIENRQISVNLVNIPISEVIRYIVSVAKLKFKLEKFAILITDKNDPGDDLSTDFFPISASFIEIIEESNEEENNIQDYFKSLGVTFPFGSSINYISAVNRLVVNNTQENLRRVRELLIQLNVSPKQIIIESKFIDVAQNDLDELGFQWFLQLRSTFGGDDSSTQRLETNLRIKGNNVTINEQGQNNRSIARFSSGLRDSAGLGIIPFERVNDPQSKITTYLNKYEYTTFLRLLDQKESVDILSAPRLATTNGETAILSVSEERYFPESWEPPQVTNTGAVTVITPATPQFAPPRDIGVQLEATPQIDPDGYSVQLQIVPEITEFIGFDTSFNESTEISNGSSSTPVILRFDVPIISIRRIESSILLYDGETVVLGGLIKETIRSVKDKIPFISNIPLIGRLFQSNAIISEKRNFLVFVSVRLISPSGISIRQHQITGLPSFKQL